MIALAVIGALALAGLTFAGWLLVEAIGEVA